jgi:hypothetical protein
MARLTVEIEIDVHAHSPRHHRSAIGGLLDQVKHSVAVGDATEGQIITPAAGAVPREVVGFWKLDETADQEIAA